MATSNNTLSLASTPSDVKLSNAEHITKSEMIQVLKLVEYNLFFFQVHKKTGNVLRRCFLIQKLPRSINKLSFQKCLDLSNKLLLHLRMGGPNISKSFEKKLNKKLPRKCRVFE